MSCQLWVVRSPAACMLENAIWAPQWPVAAAAEREAGAQVVFATHGTLDMLGRMNPRTGLGLG